MGIKSIKQANNRQYFPHNPTEPLVTATTLSIKVYYRVS